MGAIANAIVAYAQPLLDQTNGDVDQMNRAMMLGQMCWNLALLPEERRDAAIEEMQPALNMTDGEFAEFRQQIVLPMIQRHHEMFPAMHARAEQRSKPAGAVFSPTEDRPAARRNDPCPCGSGRKYKRCCGRK